MKTALFIVSMAALAGVVSLALDRIPLDVPRAATHSPLAQLYATRQEQALLYAIGQVESGGNYSAVSNDGNHFGRYQMSNDLLLRLWGQPQLTPDVQDALALCHLRHLELKDGSGFHPEELAALWRGRYDADYRQRVLNLYNSKINNQK